MEIVVLPTKTEEVKLKSSNLIEKLNTRIREKVDECNALLDKIQLSSTKEIERRKSIDKENEDKITNYRLLIQDLNRQLIMGTNGEYKFDNITINKYGIDCDLIGPIFKVEKPHYLCNGYGRTTYYLQPVDIVTKFRHLKRLVTELIDEYNERKPRTGDRELSKNDTEVSA